MFPQFIHSIVDDPLRSERNKTPVNVYQCKHLRTSSYNKAQTQQKSYTIEFVGCDVIWNYNDVSSRNLEYEMISKNQWDAYKEGETIELKILND